MNGSNDSEKKPKKLVDDCTAKSGKLEHQTYNNQNIYTTCQQKRT